MPWARVPGRGIIVDAGRAALRAAARAEGSNGQDMITEIITFAIPDGMTREEVMANYRRSAPGWRANPDLIRKHYLFDPETRRAGGVYLWRSMEGARRARDAAWLERVRRTYGSEPVVQYFETPIVADNALGQTIEALASDSQDPPGPGRTGPSS